MESAEHAWIGDQLTLSFEDGKQKAAGLGLHIRLAGSFQYGPTITYGQGIALGGDFYGVVDQPISTADDPQGMFRRGWQQLATPYIPHERSRILGIMEEEIKLVMAAFNAGKDPSKVYEQIGDRYSIDWAFETVFRYPRLAIKNFDHFGANAVTAYTVGHGVALDEARLAADEPKGSVLRRARLERAYAMNAFADHFLTDLFSTGHLRVPRVELYENINDKIVAGNLSRTMHNEDSEFGLRIRNQMGETWTAYGDKRLLDKVSADNRQHVTVAAQMSADEVWKAFSGEPVPEFGALKLIPDFTYLIANPGENFRALFKLNEPGSNLPLLRKDLHDRQCQNYVSNWNARQTLSQLAKGAPILYQPVRCLDLESGKFLGWMSVSSAVDPYLAIAPDKAAAHPCVWYFYGEDLYLRKDTSGGDRYLGLSPGSRSGWGLWTGQSNPIIINKDMTISLASDPKRLLCVDRWINGYWGGAWTDGTPNRFVIQIDLPLPVRIP
ncbi:MAG: hypothetical protein HOV77_21970 [Hamadaea sp.]|uniref:hypothetical protein n=1 Tax=Hamadaea sp. TaxID=2024425 RepID=UPI0017A316D8|nr:hypothetical protein [Hamadaea sp.]NUT21851.1 hypothetical protein [Hamadaea sp.]